MNIQKKMCLFFVSNNHLIVLLNSIINRFVFKGKMFVLSDYDKEDMTNKWHTIVNQCDLKNIDRICFLQDTPDAVTKNDIVVRIEPSFKYNVKENETVIDCYDMFLHKRDIKEITQNYSYMINSFGVVPTDSEKHGRTS